VHEVTEAVEKLSDYLVEHAVETEELGRLPDATVEILKQIGVIRMLQPHRHGGMEAAPSDFYEAIIRASRYCASTGWVCGIVGVHPWELALCDPRVQDEIWGDDVNRWVASPYAPLGRARRVDGGFVMSGRWPFSSGTDHCEWVFLGGLIIDENRAGGAPESRHFLLPRNDYEILPDSWNVIGLKGTGSKDVVVEEAFIPEYRTVDPVKLVSGELAAEMARSEPLYRMPFLEMFCGAIVASVIGIAEGALAAAIEYHRGRGQFGRAIDDPHAFSALGAAAADIEASHVHFMSDMSRMFDVVNGGGTIDLSTRADARRNQVRASRRAVDAIDDLFRRAGGGALRLELPFQRFWRDAHAAMNHAVNVAEPVYVGWGSHLLGLPMAPNATI
jgi:3-hydroxy-9,10-secoandrosta-1,3,5(10)-triene-9,17-dione monooxygenase